MNWPPVALVVSSTAIGEVGRSGRHFGARHKNYTGGNQNRAGPTRRTQRLIQKEAESNAVMT